MSRLYAVVLLVVMTPAGICAAPTLNGEPDDLANYLLEQRKLIVISGYGEDTAKADSAVVSLMVKTKDSRLRPALDKYHDIRAAIRNKLINSGITEENIQFSKYSSTPTYGWFGEKPSSYEITNEVKVTLDAEEKLLPLADIIDTIESVFLIKTELTHSGKKQSESNALTKALEDITRKKQLYEKTLGVTLSLVRIIEQSSYAHGLASAWEPQVRKSAPSSIVSGGLEESSPLLSSSAGGFGEIIYRNQMQAEYIVTPQ